MIAVVKAAPHQRGFWIDRVAPELTQVGLGTHVLIVEHAPCRRWGWGAVLGASAAAAAALQFVDLGGLLP